jgi:hypothetical protein
MSGPLEVIGPIQGTSEGVRGADVVPPSLDPAREFARHSKAENTLRGSARTGGTSAGGANRTRLTRCLRRLRPSRPISQSVPGG